MVHYAVENVLTAHGVLNRVAAGEDAAFTMQAEAESDRAERPVEVVQDAPGLAADLPRTR